MTDALREALQKVREYVEGRSIYGRPHALEWLTTLESALQEPAPVVAREPVAWPTMPPSRGQSPVLFEDGYAEGWAKCLDQCQAAYEHERFWRAELTTRILEALEWAGAGAPQAPVEPAPAVAREPDAAERAAMVRARKELLIPHDEAGEFYSGWLARAQYRAAPQAPVEPAPVVAREPVPFYSAELAVAVRALAAEKKRGDWLWQENENLRLRLADAAPQAPVEPAPGSLGDNLSHCRPAADSCNAGLAEPAPVVQPSLVLPERNDYTPITVSFDDGHTELLNDLLQELNAFRAAPQLVEDARRLDWLAAHCRRPDSTIRFDDGSMKSCFAWAIASATDDLRGAIDAARSIAKGVES